MTAERDPSSSLLPPVPSTGRPGRGDDRDGFGMSWGFQPPCSGQHVRTLAALRPFQLCVRGGPSVAHESGRDDERAGAMIDGPISRRDILRLAGAGAGVAALSPLLAACGSGSKASTAPAASAGGGGGAASAGAGGSLQPPSTAVNLEFWNPFTGGDGPLLPEIAGQGKQETPEAKVKITTHKEPHGPLHPAEAPDPPPQ